MTVTWERSECFTCLILLCCANTLPCLFFFDCAGWCNPQQPQLPLWVQLHETSGEKAYLLNVSFCPCDCFVFHHGLTLVIVFQCFVLYFGDSFFRHATPPLVSCADGEKSTIPSSLAVQDHANTRTAKHPTRANACVVHNWCAPAALGLFAAAPAIRAAQNARLASMVAPAVAGPWIKVALARV